MLSPKEKLASQLTAIIQEHYITNQKETRKIYKILELKHKIPVVLSSNIMTLKTNLQTYSSFILFCIAEAIEVNNSNFQIIEKYYSAKEIKNYSTDQYEFDEIKNPYVLEDMTCVRDQQYIGKIDAKELHKLDQAGMINYNERTQRVMKRVIDGNDEYWKITISKASVEAIKNLMRNGMYFPDPITLNIPQDDDSYAEYNKEDHTLTIQDLNHFDILDGYHRYVAMMELIAENPDFNYVMELRVTEWSENQAQQFIFQQDQKTKMSVANSRSFDQNSLANRIVDRLNVSMSSVSGKIGRSGSLILTSDISAAIDKLLTKGIDPSSKQGRQLLQSLTQTISDRFDVLFADDECANIKYEYKILYIIMYMIKSEVPREHFVNTFKTLLDATSETKLYLGDTSRKISTILTDTLNKLNVLEQTN